MSTVVCPAESLDVTSTTSRSTLDMLRAAPESCGRSPTTDTGTPSRDRVLLKKLSIGFTASTSRSALPRGAVPKSRESPVF